LRHLRTVSILMTLTGVAAIAAALALDISRTVLLVGMMLVVAGGVKIVIVGLWNGVAGFGDPVHTDGIAHPASGKERLR
jgi:hypothetical protein